LGNSAVLILGIKAYHGDVSAVLIHDGDLVVAVEEERGLRMCECGLRNVECGIRNAEW